MHLQGTCYLLWSMISDKDDDGVGEICFKWTHYQMGYYKNKESTDEVIEDGWFHTGDQISERQGHYLYYRGVKKNVIIAANRQECFPRRTRVLPMKNECIKSAWYGAMRIMMTS